MTYNEKKSLYESIMNDVAKIVKRKLNESSLKPIFKKAPKGSVSGISHYGYILFTSKRNLIKIFGVPTYTSKDFLDDSSQYEWDIEMDYLGSTYIFTIYDTEDSRINNNDIIEWHIGAHSDQESRFIRNVVKDLV